MYKWPVFCLIVLIAVIADLVKEVTALKKGDAGVCITKLTTMTTRRVTYTRYSSNKWCGHRKCVARVAKTQPYKQTFERLICCSGFKYEAETDDCTPLCTTGCHGGRCVAPETCQCDPPLYLDPTHQNTCIQPVCNPPCLNANCTANNTCKCHPGFKALNSTHCYKCEPGYTISPNFTCIATCECSSGECNPEDCSCSPGYVKNGSKCEPVCDCVNSTCVAPDTCACLDGYSAINRTHCVPVCNLCDGNCVAPNVCQCFKGHSFVDGACRPVCNLTCENGFCSGSNECTCNEGYVKNEPNKCYKPDPACKTCGLIEPGEGRCEITVDCCKGWIYREGKCMSKPKCNPPCRNAECTYDNFCTCNRGLQPLNATLCVPPCPPGQHHDLSDPAFLCKSR